MTIAVAERPETGAGQALQELPLELVDVGENVRKDAMPGGEVPASLMELAQSICEVGVLQPVRAIGPDPKGRYELVWGQRRFLASEIASKLDAGKHVRTIPALVEPSADVAGTGPKRSFEQLIENLQRADLNPIDEAVALRAVLDGDKRLTQAELARRLGLSPSWLANTLSLLDLPKPVQTLIATEQLTASHAKAIAGLPPKAQTELAKEALDRGMSAHGLEEAVKWRRQQDKREADRRAELEAAAELAVTKLRELAYPAGSTVYMESWGTDTTVFQKAIQAAGWKFSTSGSWPKAGAACDCIARKLTYSSWGKDRVSVTPACVKSEHVNAKERASNQRREEKTRLQSERRAKLRTAVDAWIQAKPIDGTIARFALWAMLGEYGREQLAKRVLPKDKKADGWAALASLADDKVRAQLAEQLIRSTDSWQNDAPLEAMLVSFGVEPPAPAEKPAKTKKAAKA